MTGFQRKVETMPRTQAAIDAEKNEERRAYGVAMFVEATKAHGGGAFGYQLMLEQLFKRFAAGHSTDGAVATVLEALKPVLREHDDFALLRKQFEQILRDVESSR